jgi:hypothetical protein
MIPIIDDSYKNKEWAFPPRDQNPANKGAEYCRQNNQAIYSLFCRNKMAWGAGDLRTFGTLRDYSNGRQSTDQYKSFLLNDINDNGTSVSFDSFDQLPLSRVAKRQGWYNMIWDNISPAPMIMNALHGQFDKLDFDLNVSVVDPDSRALEEEQAFLKLIEAQNAEWQNKIKMEMGIPIDEDVMMPRSKEELDMLKAKDGFKLNVARAMQKILRHSFEVSRWDNVVRKKLIDDLICLGYCVVRDFYNAETGMWECEYVDPATYVTQVSNETDYSDAEYGGQFILMTISNLRNKLPDVPEEELKAMAGTMLGNYGNPKEDWPNHYSLLDPSTGICNYDGFKVPVFKAWWVDTDTKKRLWVKSRYGREKILDIPYDSDEKTMDKLAGGRQEVRPVFIRNIRECSWVIGKDWVFDYGVIKMASRDGYKKPQAPYHVEQLLQPSIIERIRSILDQIEITFLRYQNSLAQMFENGIAVNVSMLGNVNLGGGMLKPAQVIKLYKQTGVLPYQYGASTGHYTGGAALPITPIPGGMQTRVEETIRMMDMWMQQIERHTGINPVTLGATPDPNAPVGTTEAAMQATANVIKPIADACFEVKESVGTSMMRRIQIGIRNSEQVRKSYGGIVSPMDIDALRLMESDGVQYGLSLKAKPDTRAKMRFEKWIDIALQNTREKRPGIDLNDAIYFMSRLEAGDDLNDLEKQLEYAIEKNKQEAAAQSERMIQAQGEQNTQLEQAKMQSEMARIKAEAEASMAEEALRGQIKAQQSSKEIVAQLWSDLRQTADAEDGILTQTGR